MPAAAGDTTFSARYLKNIAWTWAGGALNLFIGVFLSPSCWISQSSWLPGTGWRELIPAGLATAALYWTIAYWTIIEKSHREAVWGLAKRVQERIRPVRARADAAQNVG